MGKKKFKPVKIRSNKSTPKKSDNKENKNQILPNKNSKQHYPGENTPINKKSVKSSTNILKVLRNN